jgi:hypothetical protein
MDLSFILTTITICILGYAGITWVNSAYITPRRAAKAVKPGETVKKKRRISTFKKGSRVPNVQNPENTGSAQTNAKSAPANVPANVPGSVVATPQIAVEVPPSNTLDMTPNELHQLLDAITARANGATIDEAILKGFGLKKGGGPSYKRARELFDLGTKAP